ncbi:unnamed protein product, partial [Symbiodinium sp. CCMP2592]
MDPGGSCRLVLDASLAKGSPASVAALTGSELWQHVWRVDMPCEASEEMPTCPICLGEPELIRTPPCGHVICYLCVPWRVQHAATLGEACKCPVCSQAMRLEDLRPVRLELQHLPKPEEGGSLVFTLVRRTGLHYLSLAGAIFARRIFGDPELYLSSLHEDLRVLESAAAAGGEEAGSTGEVCHRSSSLCIQCAMGCGGPGSRLKQKNPCFGLDLMLAAVQLIFLEPYLMKQLLSEHRWASAKSEALLFRSKSKSIEPLTDQMKQ